VQASSGKAGFQGLDLARRRREPACLVRGLRLLDLQAADVALLVVISDTLDR
jgi:hypothetical protein